MRNANVAGTAGLTLIMGIGKVQKCPSTPLRLATQDDDYAYGKLREARSIGSGNPGEIVSYHSLFLFVILSTTAVSREAWATLPETSSRPLPATLAQSRNLAHASLETAVHPTLRFLIRFHPS